MIEFSYFFNLIKTWKIFFERIECLRFSNLNLAETFLLAIAFVFANRFRINGRVDVTDLGTGTRVFHLRQSRFFARTHTMIDEIKLPSNESIKIGSRLPAVNVAIIDHRCTLLTITRWCHLLSFDVIHNHRCDASLRFNCA